MRKKLTQEEKHEMKGAAGSITFGRVTKIILENFPKHL